MIFHTEGGDANSQKGCANLLFCKNFAEKCMKTKEFGSKGYAPGTPLDPSLVMYFWNIGFCMDFKDKSIFFT